MKNQEKKSFKSYIPRIILLIILLSAAIYAYKKYEYNQHFEKTDNAQIETYNVPIVSRVSGYAETINLKDFESVKKGQLLVSIDKKEQILALEEMQAMYQQMMTEVESAEASIKNTKMTLSAAESTIKSVVLRKEKAQKDLERDTKLYTDKAITKKQLDDSKANLDIIEAQLDAQRQELNASKSRVDIQSAALHRAEAALQVQKAKIEQQKLKIGYYDIFAGESGKIGRKSVEPGQFIQAGQTIATIVQDSLYWVIANFKETQLQRLAVGQTVNITMDAYPDLKLTGKILEFSEATGAKFSLLPPDNASGNFVKVTQKIPVKISINQLNEVKDKLRSGMSLEVEVKIK